MQSNKISITKDLKDDFGPLGGVLSAMKWIKTNKKNINGYQLFHQILLFLQKKNLKFFMKKLKLMIANYFL